MHFINQKHRFGLPGVESLESRRLLSVAVVNPLSDLSVAQDAAPTTIDLSNRYAGTTVRFATSLGNIDVELTDTVTPKTVRNFLNYLDRYAGTFFHRSVNDFVLQGGGYTPATGFPHIIQDATVQNEFQSGVTTNTKGTIAMAKLGGDPNSASSEFFFNLADNTSNLDGQNGGFTTFGTIVDGQDVVDAIAALTPTDISAETGNSALSATPLQANGATTNDKLVYINTLGKLDNVFSVSSDNPGLVTTSISNGQLILTYTAGASGSANITVTVTTPEGQATNDAFVVSVAGSNIVKIGVGGFKSVAYTDPDGTLGTISLSKGTGNLVFSGTNITQTVKGTRVTVTGDAGAVLNSIDVTATAGAGALSITGRGGNGTLDILNITTDAGLASIVGKIANVSQQLLVNGDVKSVALGSVKAIGIAGSTTSISLGALTGPLNIIGAAKMTTIGTATGAKIYVGSASTIAAIGLTVNTANDVSVFSKTPINKLSTKGWNNTDGVDDVIDAPSIAALSGSGDFGASLTLKSDVAKTLGSTTVKGQITGGFWSISGNISAIGAGVIAGGWNINSNSALGTLTSKSSLAAFVVADSVKALTVKGDFTGRLRVDGAINTLSTTGNLVSVGSDSTNDPNGITALGIGKLIVGGNLSDTKAAIANAIGSLTVKGNIANTSLTAGSIASANVSQNISGSLLRADAAFAANSFGIGKITVRGQIDSSTIYAVHGNIKGVSASAILNATIAAGVTQVPSAISHFVDAAAIRSLVVRPGAQPTFKGSLVIARFLGTMNLGTIGPDNGGTAYGLFADSLSALTLRSASGGLTRKNLTTADKGFTITDFSAQIFD